MSKKKGLSVEEKRKVILGIYHVQKEPFNLKEMEAIGSRMGVVQQTIKDVSFFVSIICVYVHNQLLSMYLDQSKPSGRLSCQ